MFDSMVGFFWFAVCSVCWYMQVSALYLFLPCCLLNSVLFCISFSVFCLSLKPAYAYFISLLFLSIVQLKEFLMFFTVLFWRGPDGKWWFRISLHNTLLLCIFIQLLYSFDIFQNLLWQPWHFWQQFALPWFFFDIFWVDFGILTVSCSFAFW